MNNFWYDDNNIFDANKIYNMNLLNDKWYKTFRYTGSFHSELYFEVEPWGRDFPVVSIRYKPLGDKTCNLSYYLIPRFICSGYIVQDSKYADKGYGICYNSVTGISYEDSPFNYITSKLIANSTADIDIMYDEYLYDYTLNIGDYIITREYYGNTVTFTVKDSKDKFQIIDKIRYTARRFKSGVTDKSNSYTSVSVIYEDLLQKTITYVADLKPIVKL